MNSSFRVEESPTKTSELGQKRSSSELNEPSSALTTKNTGTAWTGLSSLAFLL